MPTVNRRLSVSTAANNFASAKQVLTNTVFDRPVDNLKFSTPLPPLTSDRMLVLNIGHRKDIKATFEKPVVVSNFKKNDWGKLRMRVKVDDKALMALYALHQQVSDHYGKAANVTVREPAYNDAVEIGFPSQYSDELPEVWVNHDNKDELFNAEMVSSIFESQEAHKLVVRMGVYCIPKPDQEKYMLGYFFTLERVEL